LTIDILYAGRMEYGHALDLQIELWKKVASGENRDTLILLEHPDVITLGIRGKKDNILIPEDELKRLGVEIRQIDRGGDVTYHGPGQIVGYPIMNLNNWGRDIHDYIMKVENTFIKILEDDYQIKAVRDDKTYTGVWVGTDKITAIGIQVKRWTTMHGFAFNVNTDLSRFEWIVPCGLKDRGVTSIQKLTGKEQDMGKLFKRTAEVFCECFNASANFLPGHDMNCKQ